MENCAHHASKAGHFDQCEQNHARDVAQSAVTALVAVEVGAQFGRLTLVAEQPREPGKKPKWLMRCACGVEKSIALYNVRTGRQLSCGCLRNERTIEANRLRLDGERSGMLLVLRFFTSYQNESLWLCLCDCGCGYIGRGTQISTGRVTSCGCVRRKFEDRQKSPEDLQRYARNHVRRARQRGAEGRFTRLDIERIYALQRGRCAWCPANLADGFHRDHRVPISKGGSNHASNIDLLCPKCNIRKQDKDPVVWAKMTGRLL